MFTLTGTLIDHAGDPLAEMQLLIQPTPTLTVDHAGQTVRLGGTQVTTDEGGYFTVDLATGPDLWYTVRSTAGGRLTPRRFKAPADGAVLDLSDPDVFPQPAPSPMAEYVRGASAYEVAVRQGFVGTEDEWLASLTGEVGQDVPQIVADRGVLTFTIGA